MIDYLKLFVISMIPIVELRGAVPMGILWGHSFWSVYLVCVLGNLLPVPFLILFAGKILKWAATLPKVGFLFQKIIDRGERKAASIGTLEWLGLFLFVAVPLPGTGAWTGSLVATLLQMKVQKAFWPIALGVVTAGILMGIATYGVSGLIGLF